MTTEVIVRANHGWPVEVTQLRQDPTAAGPNSLSETWTQRVEPGTERTFHVHSGHDLRIHEVQPGEDAALAAGIAAAEG